MNTQFPLPSTGLVQERTLASDLLERFSAIVGEKYAVTDPAAQEPYLVEGRGFSPWPHAGGAAARIGRGGCRHRAAGQ